MQNQKLKSLKDDLVDIKTKSESEAIKTSNEKPLPTSDVELGKAGIKSNDGFNLLGAVLETAFFFTLFEYTAHRQFDSNRRSLRIAKMKAMHPRLYLACLWGDFIVRCIVVFAIVSLAIFAAYKVVK